MLLSLLLILTLFQVFVKGPIKSMLSKNAKRDNNLRADETSDLVSLPSGKNAIG